MFGKNKIVKANYKKNGKLNVHSVFSTIQGEGPYAGVPALFIRLAGCNLNCWFCDTDFETDTEFWSIKGLFEYCVNHEPSALADQRPLVVITGGEPMLQADITELCLDLIDYGFRVQIETAGTVWQKGFDNIAFDRDTRYFLSFVVSPKTGRLNKDIQSNALAFKYVIREGEVSEEDGLPVMSTQNNLDYKILARPTYSTVPVYVMPMDEQNSTLTERNTQVAVNIAMKYGYKLCLQIHKLAGLE